MKSKLFADVLASLVNTIVWGCIISILFGYTVGEIVGAIVFVGSFTSLLFVQGATS